MSKGGIIDIIAVLSIIVASFVGIRFLQNNHKTTAVSDQDLLSVIVRDRPSLSFKNQPIIQIAAVKNPAPTWYVVTIKSLHTQQDFIPVKVLIKGEDNDTIDPLRVILGPDVNFSDTILSTVSLPDSVIMELQKS